MNLFRKLKNYCCPTHVPVDVSAIGIKERIVHYGFVEVSDVLAILAGLDEDIPDENVMSYILDCLKTCLINHDRGEAWFLPIRDVINDVQFHIMKSSSYFPPASINNVSSNHNAIRSARRS